MSSSGWLYVVEADSVGDVPGICGGLWDNLKNDNFDSACLVHAQEMCREDGNGGLFWQFSVPVGCNEGHVESAWWEATSNDYGDITC